MIVIFNVDNIREAIQEMESKGYPFIPAPGGEKTRSFRDYEFAFIHPKKVNNVLLELIEDKWDETLG
jgi:methylmalonyl-CoA/ethylmalonyl-CoA epimerase